MTSCCSMVGRSRITTAPLSNKVRNIDYRQAWARLSAIPNSARNRWRKQGPHLIHGSLGPQESIPPKHLNCLSVCAGLALVTNRHTDNYINSNKSALPSWRLNDMPLSWWPCWWCSHPANAAIVNTIVNTVICSANKGFVTISATSTPCPKKRPTLSFAVTSTCLHQNGHIKRRNSEL